MHQFRTAFGILLGFWFVSQVFVVLGLIQTVSLIGATAADTAVDEAALISQQNFDNDVGMINLALSCLTFAVWIAWLLHARMNAESLHPARHRHAPAWVIGSWFVPVLWFWYPKQIVDDVWRASDPAGRVGPVRRPALSTVWWALWWTAFGVDLLSNVWSVFTAGLISGNAYALLVPSYAVALVAATVAQVLLVPTWGLMYLIAHRITGFQHAARNAIGPCLVPVAPPA